MKDKNLWLIMILATLVYGANLGGTSIYVLDEAKNAACAAEMYATNNWFVPVFNGEWRTDKPPLHYFFMWMGIKAFGVSPFAVRFFSMVFGVLTVLSTYLFTKNVLGKWTAFYAALILIASLQMALQFHLAVPDPYLIFFMTTGLYLLYWGIEMKSNRAKLGSYAMFSFAFLAKGLIAIVLPGCIVVVFVLWRRKKFWKSLQKLQLELGALIFLIIALPWFIINGVQTDWQWIQGYFVEHHFNRYTTTFEGHNGFFLSGFVFLLLALLPFSVFAPQAIFYGWVNRNDSLFKFLLSTVMVIAVFFSFSKTILPSYPEPAAPFLAILIAYYLKNVVVMRRLVTFGVKTSMFLYFLLATGLPIAIYFALKKEGMDIANANYFVVLPIGAVLTLRYLWKGNLKFMIVSMVATWAITTLVFFVIAWPKIDAMNPVELASQVITKDHSVAYYNSLNPAFVFRHGEPIQELKSELLVMEFLQCSKNILITDRKGAEQIVNAIRVDILFTQKNLFESGNVVLLIGKDAISCQ